MIACLCFFLWSLSVYNSSAPWLFEFFVNIGSHLACIGPFTIHIQQSILHKGSGWTFYLSEDGNDSSRCLLLDHIPANPEAASFPFPDPNNPDPFNEDYWDQFFITLEIPDVACEKCSIQMQNIMVDKASDEIAAPDGTGCTYDGQSGTCALIPGGYGYHSCSVPLRITGTIPRADYACPGQPEDWPTEFIGDDGAPVDASVPGLYRREEAAWADGFPRDIPEKYRTWAVESVRLQDDGHCPFVSASRQTPDDSSDDELSSGAIAGIAVGCVAAMALWASVPPAKHDPAKQDLKEPLTSTYNQM